MKNVYVQYPARSAHCSFNENEFIRLVFTAKKLQIHLNSYSKKLLSLIPGNERQQPFTPSYFLTAFNLAHIIERHYTNKEQQPDASRFAITLPEIIQHIQDGCMQPAEQITGIVGLKRILQIGRIIGKDRSGSTATCMTIITDVHGQIRTAYPGLQ